jgi:hypothetical protein
MGDWENERDNKNGKFQTAYDRAEGKEVYFSSYAEVEAWDRANPGVQFIRRRSGDGYTMKILAKTYVITLEADITLDDEIPF